MYLVQKDEYFVLGELFAGILNKDFSKVVLLAKNRKKES